MSTTVDDRQYTALEGRVIRLEATLRWLGFGLLVAVGGLLVAASDNDWPTDLRVRSLEWIDDEGRTRGRLEVAGGGGRLALVDEQGVERLTLADGEEGTRLYIQDDQGVTRLGAAQFAHGGGGYALHGPGGKGAAVLYLKGEGSLSFFDSAGERTHRFPASESSAPAGSAP